MHILCKLFDHKISGNKYSNEPHYIRYFSTDNGGILDGINTLHLKLYTECDRCHKLFHVGNIHATKDRKI